MVRFVLVVILSLEWLSAQEPLIERIDIRGNRRIPRETIQFYITSREGEPYLPDKVLADHRALLRTNFFDDVQVDESEGTTGWIITFIVTEKSLVREIKYEGLKSFKESDILNQFKERKVSLTPDSPLDEGRLVQAKRAIKELLIQHGKPLATVDYKMEKVPPDNVIITFVIDEGEKVRIGQIDFVGNTVFSDGKLRDALKLTKERNMIEVFRGKDKYHEGKLEYDLETNVRALYQEHGYLKLQMGEPRVEIKEGPRGFLPLFRKTKKQFFITISVEEADQFKIGEIKIEGSTVFKPEALQGIFGLKAGDVADFKKMKDALEAIKKLYGQMGYINWTFLPEYALDEAKKLLNVTYTFQEDKRFTVRRIDFEGNTKTRDKVLRREFALEEQQTFNSALLDWSILRLNQLGFFEKIEDKDYEVKPDNRNGTVELLVKVKEKGQQSIGLTGGVSGISGSFIGLSYSSENFRGKGQRIEFDIMAGTRTTNFLFSFTEPYFLDTRWSTGVSVFNQRFRFDTFGAFGLLGGLSESGDPIELFTRKTSGATLSLSHPLGRGAWRTGLSYSLQNISISDVQEAFRPFALSQLLGFVPTAETEKALQGIIRSELTPSLVFDTSDSPFFASRGQRLFVSTAVTGGFLGGDINLIRPLVDYRYFKPSKFLRTGSVIAMRSMGSYVRGFSDTSVPFFDRFFLGGEQDIRGFDIRSISPRAISISPQTDAEGNAIIDSNTGLPLIIENLISTGGDALVVVNTEYRIPIVGPLTLAPFFDVGTTGVVSQSQLGNFLGATKIRFLGNTDFVWRASTGLELQFLLPVINAPFRLIFAFNPIKYDDFITINGIPIRITEPERDIKFTIGRTF
ncbi:MAG: outer membrane protein assembly factor BamA [Acidobacteria bacterium]|nr:outer membrane protein assembly factor BamA [Acidobacteriota bacterium]